MSGVGCRYLAFASLASFSTAAAAIAEGVTVLALPAAVVFAAIVVTAEAAGAVVVAVVVAAVAAG